MSTTIRRYAMTVLDTEGRLLRHGQRDSPFAERTVSGSRRTIDDQQTVPKNDGTATLYDWTTHGPFELFAARIVGDGYLDLALFLDEPTDAAGGDLTPSGNAPTWIHLELSCLAEFQLDTDEADVHATPASYVADNAGVPALWTDPTRKAGKVYKIMALNRSTSDDVLVRTLVVQ